MPFSPNFSKWIFHIVAKFLNPSKRFRHWQWTTLICFDKCDLHLFQRMALWRFEDHADYSPTATIGATFN